MRQNIGIKILKNQRVILQDNKVTLTDLEEKSEGNDDIMGEMRNIFEGEDNEEKPKTKRPSQKVLTEEDLIKMLELDDDDLEENQENASDNDWCSCSDASEDAIQLDEDEIQVSVDATQATEDTNAEWKTERDPSIAPLDFDGQGKILKILPETNEPYEYFKLIATDEFSQC